MDQLDRSIRVILCSIKCLYVCFKLLKLYVLLEYLFKSYNVFSVMCYCCSVAVTYLGCVAIPVGQS